MKILVVELAHLGDFIVSTSVMGALKESFPDSTLVAVVIKAVRDVAKLCPYVDEVEVYDYRGEHRGLGGWLDIVKRLRRYGFDLGVATNFSFREGLLLYLAGCKERVGSPTQGRGIFLTRKGRYIPRGVMFGFGSEFAFDSMSSIRLKALEPLGIRGLSYPRLSVPDDLKERVYDRFLRGRDRLMFSIGVSGDGTLKRWGIRSWKLLGERILESYGGSLLIIGSPDEADYGEALSKVLPSSINTAGKTSVLDFVALLSLSDLHIGVDSAPLHAASALGKRCVSLFGPTNPFRWAPMAPPGMVRAVYKFFPCSPCYYRERPCFKLRPYGVRPCMSSISVEDVLREVNEHMIAIKAEDRSMKEWAKKATSSLLPEAITHPIS